MLEILNILLCVPSWMCRYDGGCDDLFDEMVCLEVFFSTYLCVSGWEATLFSSLCCED